MTVLLAAAAGLLVSRVVWLLLRPTFHAEVLVRSNYRGASVPVAAGIVLPVALVVVEAGRAVAGSLGIGDGSLAAARALTVVAALGFGLLGAFDDLVGDASSKGFRGHAGALARGRLTTGGLKLAGGAAVAVVTVAPVGDDALLRLAVDAALVALSANLANLFDRAPGRTIKVSVLAGVALVAATGAASVLAPLAVVVGASLGLLRDDLRERLMLGDAGANVLGATLGLGVVLATVPGTRAVVLAVVVALNAAAEVVSFSRVIERVPPLRAMDRAGRLH